MTILVPDKDFFEASELQEAHLMILRESLYIGRGISVIDCETYENLEHKGKRLKLSPFRAEFSDFYTHPSEVETYKVVKASFKAFATFEDLVANNHTKHETLDDVPDGTAVVFLFLKLKAKGGGRLRALAKVET